MELPDSESWMRKKYAKKLAFPPFYELNRLSAPADEDF